MLYSIEIIAINAIKAKMKINKNLLFNTAECCQVKGKRNGFNLLKGNL